MVQLFSAEEVKGLNDRVLREVPDEKAKAVLDRASIARVLAAAGSVRRDGLGQRAGVVDARTFFRFHQQDPGCWNNKKFRDEFLGDNPHCRGQGYRPKASRKIFDMGAKTA